MTRRRDIKKSDFVLVDSSESNDTFDLVRNGQNLKIKQSSLISDFGVSGTLETRGEVTGTPVLTVIAGVNYIRNILGGAGINVALSAQDGVEISHNFTADGTGTPVLINSGSDSPTIRSIQAGAGISVAGVGGIIQIASTGTPASSKTIIVYSIDDILDAADSVVGDVVTLADNIEYKLENDVSSAYQFVMGSNTVLSGADRDLITLTYTGIYTMITAVDVDTKIKDINLSCGSGTLFDVSSTTGVHRFRAQNISAICDNVGTFDSLATITFLSANFNAVYTQGFEFAGTIEVIIMDLVGMVMPSGTGNAITLGTSVITYIIIDKGLISVNTSGYSISGLANSGNIATDGLGSITNSRNFGSAAISDNIYNTDNRWNFHANTELPDSYNTVLATHGGATITISVIATPVAITGTWTNQMLSRFTGTAAGVWTYTGIGDNIELNASLTVNMALGQDNVSFWLYKNGVQVTGSRTRGFIYTGRPNNIVLMWEDNAVTNDYYQIYVQNDDDTEDIIIVSATMRIR